jgi:guanylate kinase
VPLLALETKGALRVKHEVPGAVTIFISARVEELERRLRERATESAGEIGERIELARKQLELAGEFDHVIENDDLERAVGELTDLARRLLTPAATMPRR